MAKSRRLQKQGPPPPLEELVGDVSSKKRRGAPAIEERSKKTVDQTKRRKILKSSGTKAQQEKTANDQATLNSLYAESKKSNQVQKVIPANGVKSSGAGEEAAINIARANGDISDPEVLEDEFEGVDRHSDFFGSSDKSDAFSFTAEVTDTDGEDETQGQDMWSDSERLPISDQAATLNAANIEGLSRHLDAQAAQKAAEAQAELEEAAIQTNIAGERILGLDDDDDDEGSSAGEGQTSKLRLAPDLQLLRSRITDTVRVLEKFVEYQSSSTGTRSRADYVQQIIKDICSYYGYSSYLAEKLFELFSPSEAFAFFEANETPRPIVIRTNTLRTNRRILAESLMNRGVRLEPVGKWTKVGLQIFESSVSLGATPEYLAGQYMMQAASSFLPVMALAPQENERVLDMAAAPGGKTTYIAALMKNTGSVIANDPNKVRTKALVGNIHRLGVKNTIISSLEAATDFPKTLGGFDRVLLDAPCSGTGVIAKDPTVKTNKTEKDFVRLPELQKKLLLAAIDSVTHNSSTGGYLVYSTCSVTLEENEAVVAYALSRRPNVKLVETGLTIGRKGFTNFKSKRFPPALSMTRRFYPHTFNIDGFFVAKFQKLGPTPTKDARISADAAVDKQPIDGSSVKLVPSALTPTIDLDDSSADTSYGNRQDSGSFGDWDSSEDATIITRARRAQLRRKGVNPHADISKSRSQSHVAVREKTQTPGK